MRQFVLGAVLLAGPLALCSGCAHVAEKKAVTAFKTALEAEDLDALRASTTAQFHRRALRSEKATDDLEILRLPTGETTVVEVKEESEDETLVTVQVGESTRKIYYRLLRDPEGGGWLVDDVYQRQKKGEVTTVRSVAEQMDLLLSVREFLAGWGDADRDAALASVTPDLEAVLRELPPDHLQRLMKRAVGEGDEQRRSRPQATLDGDVAVVVLPRPTGKMVLNMSLLEGRWKLSDLAVESKQDKEHIPSLKKTAVAMAAVTKFLDAYAKEDKAALKDVCHPKLYESSLLPADLSTVPLPDSSLEGVEYFVKMQGMQADYVIETPKRVVRLNLVRTGDDETGREPTRYLVEEVTMYGADGDDEEGIEERRLSVAFTGQALIHLFREAVHEGNLPVIRRTVTTDFNNRVWDRVGEESELAGLAPPVFGSAPQRILRSDYHGAISRITVLQSGLELTYVLSDHRGRVRVDDVQLVGSDRTVSMKETMEILLPIRSYAKSLSTGDLDGLRRNSSQELNRLVWGQVSEVPPAGREAVRNLGAPYTGLEEIGPGQFMVTLGDERFGAKVLLIEEHERRVVDDIVLVSGVQPEERALLKQSMRLQIAFHASQDTPLPPRHASPTYQAPGSGANAPAMLADEQTVPARSAMQAAHAPLPQPMPSNRPQLAPEPDPLFPGVPGGQTIRPVGFEQIEEFEEFDAAQQPAAPPSTRAQTHHQSLPAQSWTAEPMTAAPSPFPTRPPSHPSRADEFTRRIEPADDAFEFNPASHASSAPACEDGTCEPNAAPSFNAPPGW
jgi:hypothetical protein